MVWPSGRPLEHHILLILAEFVLQKRDATDCAESGIPSACQVFIGLRRCELFCSDFKWEDGTPFGAGHYENWADGEPDIPAGEQACAEMLDNGEWADLACLSLRLYVCEKPANAAPPPP